MKRKIYKKTNLKKVSISTIMPIGTINYKSLSNSICVLYNNRENKLKVTYDNKNKDSTDNKDYHVIGKKIGSKREFELLKITIDQFSSCFSKDDKIYTHNNLKVLLDILGLKTDIRKRTYKRLIPI